MAVENRMEQLLTYWEHYWYVNNTNYRLLARPGQKPLPVPFEGPMKWWSHFRKDIIDHTIGDNLARYIPDKTTLEFYNINGGAVLIPIIIQQWIMHSRRIFKLDPDLQMLLDMTSLKNVRIKDIKFPFDSFAVALDKPFVGEQGRRYDFIVACRIERNDKPGYYLKFCDQRLETPPAIRPQDKEQIEHHVSRGQVDKGLDRMAKCLKGKGRIPFGSGHFIPIHDPDMGVLEACSISPLDINVDNGPHDQDQARITGEAMARVVLGMCMYLRTLRSPSSQPSWSPPQKHGRPSNLMKVQPITDEALICLVSSRFKLSSQERVAFSDPKNMPTRNFGEKCAHARSGFWHRPAGMGHDPDYPKTDWTRPTIVREDLYLPGTVLKGSERLLIGPKEAC
jgi:hypothetical protein